MKINEVYHVINRNKYVDLNIHAFGMQQCEPGYSFSQTIRDCHILHFVISGKGFYKINGKEYEIGKGQCFYIPENSVHQYYADRKEPWEYYWVNFTGIKADYLINQAGMNTHNPVINSYNEDEIKKVFMTLVQANKMNNGRELKILSCIFDMFSSLTELQKEPYYDMHSDSKEELLQTAIDYICKNYSMDINVNKIASQVNIVRSYLYLLFKEKTGISPREFLNKVRMEKAKEILQTTKLNVSEVAYSVGYKDVFLFSRAFKKYHNINPRDVKHGIKSHTSE